MPSLVEDGETYVEAQTRYESGTVPSNFPARRTSEALLASAGRWMQRKRRREDEKAAKAKRRHVPTRQLRTELQTPIEAAVDDVKKKLIP